MARFPGKSWEVVQRLDTLRDIGSSLRTNGDDYNQEINVNAIIRAYQSGDLDWNPGLITYWSKGKQICQPRPFDWDEFFRVNKEHDGHESFWVEGVGL
jgi:hypothetical protein